jgi:Ca-activated chloride channel homolog
MTFIWLPMLAWLSLIPLFVVAYIRMQQRRRRLAARYGHPGLVHEAASRRLGVRRHIPSALFLVALTILIVALARPQAALSLPRLEGTIILAFDVSRSMAADDLKPTRLQAAKTAARAFAQRQPPTVRIGVMSFSDGGFALQAPTNDREAVLAAINRLTLQSGTSLARGIEASLKALAAGTGHTLTPAEGGSKSLRPSSNRTQMPAPTPVPKGTFTSAAIILLTDGENTQAPDPLATARMAADRGVRIYTVGIGSTAGATLHIDGFTVRSRLDEHTLRQIAQLTGGAYYNAASAGDLRTIYASLDPQLVIKPQKTEVTSLFAGAGILVLMIGGTLSLLWLGRLP